MLQGVKDREYYVIFRKFEPNTLPKLWALAFAFFIGKHKDFGHVDLVRKLGDDKTLFIMVAPWQVSVEILNSPLDEVLDTLRREVTACIKFRMRTAKDNYNIRGLIHCVGIAKSILGLRGCFVISPYQFYKQLISLGGVSLPTKYSTTIN